MQTRRLKAQEVLPTLKTLIATLAPTTSFSLIADDPVTDLEGNAIFTSRIPIRPEKSVLLGLVDCQWIILRLSPDWTYTIDLR